MVPGAARSTTRTSRSESLIGQGLQQHGIDDAEDGGGDTDAEGQRGHRGKREAAVPRQRPDAVPDITPGGLPGRRPTHIADGIPDGQRAAHLEPSGPRRLVA